MVGSPILTHRQHCIQNIQYLFVCAWERDGQRTWKKKCSWANTLFLNRVKKYKYETQYVAVGVSSVAHRHKLVTDSWGRVASCVHAGIPEITSHSHCRWTLVSLPWKQDRMVSGSNKESKQFTSCFLFSSVWEKMKSVCAAPKRFSKNTWNC